MQSVQPQINSLRRHVGYFLYVTSGRETASGGVKMAEVARVEVVVVGSVEVVGGAVTQTQDGGGQQADAERREVSSNDGERHLRHGEPPLRVDDALRRRLDNDVHVGDRVVVVVERLDAVHQTAVLSADSLPRPINLPTRHINSTISHYYQRNMLGYVVQR